jgi:diaminopimelate dehydrogenase
MKRQQVAVVGLGRLGRACALALADHGELALAGMVVPRPPAREALPARLQRFPVATHVRDLPPPDVALVCVPTEAVAPVARELLQARIPVVECASLEGHALAEHYALFDDMTRTYKAKAMVGSGWDPGLLPAFRRAFEVLIPRGRDTLGRHPGVSLHHSTAVAHLPGIKDALVGEYRGEGGALQRYVYVELHKGVDVERVRAAIVADPLFAGEATQVFAVDSLAEVEGEAGQGLVLERLAVASAGIHASLMLEARFDPTAFAAQVMLDAARRLAALGQGAHRYALGGE